MSGRMAVRILACRPDHLGDVLLTLPAVAALRAAFSDARIGMVLDRSTAEIASRCPDVDEGFALSFPPLTEVKAGAAFALEVAGTARALAGRYDAAILARPEDPGSAGLAAAAGLPIRVGYAMPGSERFLTHAIPLREDLHASRILHHQGQQMRNLLALYRYLVDHPAVLPCACKEPDFLGTHTPGYIAAHIDEYFALFPTVEYDGPLTFRWEASDRAYSHHRMYRRFAAQGHALGFEVGDFERDIEAELRAYERGARTHYLGPGLYIDRLEEWLAEYGADQVRTITTEELANPVLARAIMRALETYLGLPGHDYAEILDRRFNHAPLEADISPALHASLAACIGRGSWHIVSDASGRAAPLPARLHTEPRASHTVLNSKNISQERRRVISLLPAATEIVAALGMLDALLGVSHECDYPEEVNRKPRVTRCEIHDVGLPSAEADRWVRETLHARGTLYTMEEDRVRELRPDAILTQRLCDVCAVGYGSVARFAATLPGPPRVVSLEPSNVADILGDIETVGELLGVPERAEAVMASLTARIVAVRGRAAGAPRRRVVLLEWIDPPFSTGHWGPELVDLAGGIELLGRGGTDAVAVSWEAVVNAAPEVLVLACCGYPLERTLADLPLLRSYPGFDRLPAAERGEVYVVDGSAYFSRPGPRIVDSLEILAAILHPELFDGRFPNRGVARVG